MSLKDKWLKEKELLRIKEEKKLRKERLNNILNKRRGILVDPVEKTRKNIEKLTLEEEIKIKRELRFKHYPDDNSLKKNQIKKCSWSSFTKNKSYFNKIKYLSDSNPNTFNSLDFLYHKTRFWSLQKREILLSHITPIFDKFEMEYTENDKFFILSNLFSNIKNNYRLNFIHKNIFCSFYQNDFNLVIINLFEIDIDFNKLIEFTELIKDKYRNISINFVSTVNINIMNYKELINKFNKKYSINYYFGNDLIKLFIRKIKCLDRKQNFIPIFDLKSFNI